MSLRTAYLRLGGQCGHGWLWHELLAEIAPPVLANGLGRVVRLTFGLRGIAQ